MSRIRRIEALLVARCLICDRWLVHQHPNGEIDMAERSSVLVAIDAWGTEQVAAVACLRWTCKLRRRLRRQGPQISVHGT